MQRKTAHLALVDSDFQRAMYSVPVVLAIAEATVARRVRESSLFSDPVEGHTPFIDEKELVVGRMLGRGGFCEVREITDIKRLKSSGASWEDTNAQTAVLLSASCKEGRYAIKKLKPHIIRTAKSKDEQIDNATAQHFLRGIIDLAIESMFLSKLDHPNIIALQGTASPSATYSLDHPFFIVLDRLSFCLPDQLTRWKKKSPIKLFDRKGAKALSLFKLRVGVAKEIASALSYLHSKHVVFRDLKPLNIGFDSEGVVKLFDFGIARELPTPEKKDDNGMFLLTADSGSPRYMDPIVALGQPYNELVDVYSFSVLLWEILALEAPFKGFRSVSTFHQRVVKEGWRPNCDNTKWPHSLTEAMQRGWSDINNRPTMKEYVCILTAEIEGSQPTTKKATDCASVSTAATQHEDNSCLSVQESANEISPATDTTNKLYSPDPDITETSMEMQVHNRLLCCYGT